MNEKNHIVPISYAPNSSVKSGSVRERRPNAGKELSLQIDIINGKLPVIKSTAAMDKDRNIKGHKPNPDNTTQVTISASLAFLAAKAGSNEDVSQFVEAAVREKLASFLPSAHLVTDSSNAGISADLSYLFKFDADRREQPTNTSYTITKSFQTGLKSFARTQGMTAVEVIRRSVFAAAADPGLLGGPEVNRMESSYRALLGASRWADEPHS